MCQSCIKWGIYGCVYVLLEVDLSLSRKTSGWWSDTDKLAQYEFRGVGHVCGSYHRFWCRQYYIRGLRSSLTGNAPVLPKSLISKRSSQIVAGSQQSWRWLIGKGIEKRPRNVCAQHKWDRHTYRPTALQRNFCAPSSSKWVANNKRRNWPSIGLAGPIVRIQFGSIGARNSPKQQIPIFGLAFHYYVQPRRRREWSRMDRRSSLSGGGAGGGPTVVVCRVFSRLLYFGRPWRRRRRTRTGERRGDVADMNWAGKKFIPRMPAFDVCHWCRILPMG